MRTKTVVHAAMISLLILLVGCAKAAEPSIEQGFVNPPDSARPHTWWHWMNGNITKEGITADLEAMARVGVGGAQIFNAGESIPHGPVAFNSQEWRDLVKHAAAEAKRLGLELCMHNCAGWSSSGGPWNTPAHAMQVVVTSEKKVKGPARFEGVLEQPPTKLDCYREIAVLAFPTPSGEAITMKDCSPKVTTSAPKGEGARLIDGKTNTSVVFPNPAPKAPQSIVLEFDKPFTARTLTITPGPGMFGCSAKLEASDDGKKYRAVESLNLGRGSDKRIFTFDAVTARYYRILLLSVNAGRMKQLAIAEVNLSSQLGIENLASKAFYDRGGEVRIQGGPAVAPGEAVQRDAVVDLTDKMDKTGRLAWDVPAGDWTIVRFGYTPNGRNNHPAPPEGTGLECDKLSAEAAQAHWDGLMGKLVTELGPLAGTSFNNVLIDSYEVGTQNWTPKFAAEFRARRGYDLRPLLPVLTGRVVESPEVTERFLWDFRRTIADLFAENYSKKFAQMAHKAGMLYSVEPYGNCPSDDLQYGSFADIPMSEFWPGTGHSYGNPGNAKHAAAVAHVYGRKYVGAESFTASPEQGKWLKDPYSLKAQGDLVWAAGVNRFIFHRYAHQPWTNPTRYPGMTMGQWGTHFERTLTWWEQSRAWLKYQARAQFLLQSGRFVGDVLFYCGEGAPNGGRAGSVPFGYDYDTCSADALLDLLAVKDGRIVLPSGMSYALLVLPGDDSMTPPVLRKVAQLAREGAVIVGPPPVRSPSLAGYPQCDAQVKQLAGDLWGKAVKNQSPADALAAMKLAPDFACADPAAKVAYIHRQAQGADLYFVSNQKPQSQELACTFRVAGRQPELWHPETGVIEDAPVFTENDGRTTVPLRFDPAGSVFVVFRRPVNPDHVTMAKYTSEAGTPAIAREPQLVILQAQYGAFDAETRQPVPGKVADLTAKVAALVADDALHVQADNDLPGKDPAMLIVKELRVAYRYRGKEMVAFAREHQTLSLPEGIEKPAVSWPFELSAQADGKLSVLLWNSGTVELTTAGGKVLKATASNVPAPAEITGPWELAFPPNWGAPPKVTLGKLLSWTDHPEAGVKYFSGSATYRKTFPAAPNNSNRPRRVVLDLGDVKNIAEVKLNGKDLGILWKPPFRVDVTDVIRDGQDNELEVRITNLWPNRLIGDEQLPEDRTWDGIHLKEWPQWLLEGKPSPTGRLTFTTWHHWKKDDALLPSGLLGPVTLRTAAKVSPLGEGK